MKPVTRDLPLGGAWEEPGLQRCIIMRTCILSRLGSKARSQQIGGEASPCAVEATSVKLR
jgi:hypothetical protein